MSYIRAEWSDDSQTMIRAERADGSIVFIPPDPANADYRVLTGEDGAPAVEIEPYEETGPD
ncbi:hypothetical protein F1654_01345 [Alkalicaulis satelles]|uniref:Uncharacterized protein n=1 Tax=Alkalicaulis satelles TaxID=2609175 RepID=A0A5M6ZN55_9PROT|nr:hypothetical protein [Alkalicaulis satelles]KAA5804678.1 hypothetical protein F1654_01345 [Alkalicaulis satelles]